MEFKQVAIRKVTMLKIILTTGRKEVNSKLEKRGRYFQVSLCYLWLKSFKVKTIEVYSLVFS